MRALVFSATFMALGMAGECASATPAGTNEIADRTSRETIPHDQRQLAAAQPGGQILVSPQTRSVESGGTLPPLQQKIDAAKPGDLVRVPPGTHSGPLYIDKPLTLSGEDRKTCIIVWRGAEPTIRIQNASGVKIQKLTIQFGKPKAGGKDSCLAAVSAIDAGVALIDCRLQPLDHLRHTPHGVCIGGASNVTFTRGRIFGFTNAIAFYDGSDGAVTDSFISDAGQYGVQLRSDSRVKVEGNIIARCGYHAVVNWDGTVEVRNNLLIDNRTTGVYLGNHSPHGTVANNVLIGNGAAIIAGGNGDATIEHNLISGNKYGMPTRSPSGFVIQYNTFVGNQIAMSCRAKPDTSPRPTVRDNQYFGNDNNYQGLDLEPKRSIAKPQFVDAQNGDFSLVEGGAPADGKRVRAGLLDPAVFRRLWKTWLPAANFRVNPAEALPRPGETRITLVMHDAAIEDVAEAIGDQAGVWVFPSSSAKGAVLNVDVHDLPFVRAMDQIAHSNGLTWRKGDEISRFFDADSGARNLRLTGHRPVPPRVFRTNPRVGQKDVDPNLTEITVTFDRDMGGGFSWTGGPPVFPSGREGQKPHWRDKRTCVLPVTLEPGRYYRVGINSKSHRNFRSTERMAARPTVIYFRTRGEGEEAGKKLTKPQVVQMNPANGARDVDPNRSELRVKFSVPMGGGFSWTGGGPSFPQIPEGRRPHWTSDRMTAVLPVQLEPGKYYRVGLNSPSHINFQSAVGIPLEPVVYTFTTRAE